MGKNLIVAQSGGPTVAINATLAGVIEAALHSSAVDKIYGGFYGIEGILRNQIIDLKAQLSDASSIDLLSLTPGMALGSCRYVLPDPNKDETPFNKILALFTSLEIGYFFYIGGNDSMDTAMKFDAFFSQKKVDIKVIGCPKTIDNDLVLTDHTPGFGSALKYVATTISEIMRDSLVYSPPSVFVVEVMGRDAGWLTAGTAVAQLACGAPHLIYVPEKPFDPAQYIAAIKELLKTEPQVVIAVSEGIRGADGKYVHLSVQTSDAFGHTQLSGVGRYLEALVKKEIGCKVRSVELSVLQRAGGHVASKTDIDEARMVGRGAVELAVSGVSGKMAAIERIKETEKGEYKSKVVPADLGLIAGKVRPLPQEWLLPNSKGLTKEGFDYFLPLIAGEVTWPSKNGLPNHFVFKKDFIPVSL